MRKKLIFVFGLVLFLGLGLFLANQVQAKGVASFEGDNLGQIELAVLREGPKGGSPVLVDDHLRVTGFFYPDQGIVTGNSGGDPVIIGDHMRVDGWLFANAGIVNKGSGGDPVIIADHLRIDGEISRGFGPVKVKDDLEVTGKLSFPKNSITDAVVKNDITVSNYLPLSGGTLTGFLLVNQAIVRGESGGDPVIIGDHLRVDGEISRPFGPVKVKDDLQVTGNLSLADALTVSSGGASITGGINNNTGGITNTGAISGATNITASGRIVTSTITIFTADDTTPDVSTGNVFKTSNANTGATSVTALDGGTTGQKIVIIGNDGANATTLSDAGTLKLSANWPGNTDDTITLIYDGTNWYEISRSVN